MRYFYFLTVLLATTINAADNKDALLAQQETDSAITINKGENAKFKGWHKDMTGALSKKDFESIETDLKFSDVDENNDGYVTPEEMQKAMKQKENKE